MRFSIFPSVTQPWSEVQAVVRHAEATGWDGVYVADHFVGEGGPRAGSKPEVPGYLESTAALAALAATTERVRLGAMVFGITYRHPAVLASWAAACDILSGGRTVLGVGAGWQQNEHDQMGIRLGPPGERIDRFVEALQVMRRLLTEETVDFEGRHYQLRVGAVRSPTGAVAAADPGGRDGRPHARRRRPPRRRVEHLVDPRIDGRTRRRAGPALRGHRS